MSGCVNGGIFGVVFWGGLVDPHLFIAAAGGLVDDLYIVILGGLVDADSFIATGGALVDADLWFAAGGGADLWIVIGSILWMKSATLIGIELPMAM